MFDLPVDTQDARRDYVRFRDFLLGEGFVMLQFSVYARYCQSDERSESFRKRLRKSLPPHGQIRLITITDHQFSKMEVYIGKTKAKVEDPPSQAVLF